MSGKVPRGWLRSSSGVFSLHNSDRYCGSYLTIQDAARIFKIEPEALSFLPTVNFGKRKYLSDKQLGRAWASGEIKSPRSNHRRGRAMISFDELIIQTVIELTYPNAIIEPQVTSGKYIADFRINYRGKSLIIEFFGPYHFIRRSNRKKPLIDPRLRAKHLEMLFNLECVIWPYWVQRCSKNVRALFNEKVEGIGSIWSTTAHFGDFDFNNSADIILDINKRFRIERHDGVGYMYTDDYVTKPVHPIIKRIREGRDDMSVLIPSNSKMPAQYWLPQQLWPLISKGRFI